MNRRTFLGETGGVALLATGLGGCTKESNQNTLDDPSEKRIASYTLEELRDWYRRELFDKFLPLIDKYCIDHQYGGFMLYMNRNLTHTSQDKRGWWEGRAIWLYSFLYNTFGDNPKYLEAAQKSVKFIMKHKPSKGGLWPERYSREGKVIGVPDNRGFGTLFIANGFAEYAKAARDEQYHDIAKEILLNFIKYYDSEKFDPDFTFDVKGPPRRLGTWMLVLRQVTQMLESDTDPKLEALADRCLDAILNFHLNPEFDLICEYLNHNMSRPESNAAQIVLGHSYEILWMVMFEALRRNDKGILSEALRLLRRHVEVFWDDVYGGVFYRMDHVDNNKWGDLRKVWWAQEEVLIGSLIAVELTGERWAEEWFSRIYTLIREKRIVNDSPLWLQSTDRKHKNEVFTHVDPFHHGRCLVINLISLEQMIERGGTV